MLKKQNPYHFFNTFCLRTPLYSLNFYRKIFNTYDIDLVELRTIWEDSIVQEALFITSPELFKQLKDYFEIKNSSVLKNERLEQAFLKYLIRLSTRCTPFGLYAGVSVGSFSNSTSIELKPINQFKRITRYDTNYISSLLNWLSKNEVIKKQLLFYPNSSLYTIGNQSRYIEYELKDSKRIYSIEAFENNKYLGKILFEATKGQTIEKLANSLLTEEVSLEEANDFIELLIENQILVSELELNVTGKETLELTINRIQEFNDTQEIVFNLKLIQQHLVKLDENLGNSIDLYTKSIDTINTLGAPYKEKHLFQTDLFLKTKESILSIKHVYAIKKIIPLLMKLTPFELNSNLALFKKAFLKRYETREMPLTTVLDIESGIGYIQNSAISNTVPFLQDIQPEKKKTVNKSYKWSQVEEVIHKKLIQSIKAGDYSIELIDDDFDKMNYDWNNIPDTLSAFLEIIKINKKEHIVFKSLGAYAGNLIARFSHGDDNLLKHLKEISSVEQKMNSDKIIAEIIHLPESRTGNILKRPQTSNYEIPYLAKSTLPQAKQISIKDLWVSVQNDRIVLRSKKLNKEILPKLTCAHYYEPKALPIYYFLCDLQYQNANKYYGFSWPNFLRNHSFLPRVTYKNIIISNAKWFLEKHDIETFMSCYKDDKLLLETVKKWKKRLNVPQFIQLIEGDNTLLINLENLTSIRLLLNTIKNKSKCELEEFLFNDNTIAKRNKEQFTNECILNFYNEEK